MTDKSAGIEDDDQFVDRIEKLMPNYTSNRARTLASAALEDFDSEWRGEDRTYYMARWFDAVMLNAAQAEQVPVAWMITWVDGEKSFEQGEPMRIAGNTYTPLYASQPSPAATVETKSAPVFKAAQQAESDPSVTLDCAGAGTQCSADIVDRLRAYIPGENQDEVTDRIREAADEIERRRIAEREAFQKYVDANEALIEARTLNEPQAAQVPTDSGIEQQIYDALTISAEVVCELKCPSVWKTGQRPPHSEECKKVHAARSAWMDHCSYQDLIAAGGLPQTLGTGIPPSLPTGWTQEHAAKAAWMINTLAVTPPDEWRTKAELYETLAEFRSLALSRPHGGGK